MLNGLNGTSLISDAFFGGSGSGSTAIKGETDLDRDAFMRLLLAQLKNQDPTAPVDNQEYIAQLAQFSSLEEMQSVNENLVALAALQQENALMSQLTSASALIGTEVSYLDPTTGEPGQGTVDAVRIEGALAVLRIGDKDVPLANVTEVHAPSGEGQEDEQAGTTEG